jgi:pimeloyl-ACP methyl ester carboxylesterase
VSGRSAGTVEVSGFGLTFEDRGEGAAVVLVHGTTSTRAIWDELVQALGDGFRTIAYDRRGYGDSGAPEGYRGTTVEEQAEDAAAVIARVGAAPALLCGHSFGAVVCLDLLRRHPDLVRGAVLIEPPLLALSPIGAEVTGELRQAVERGARVGKGAGAVEAWLEAVCGPAILERLGSERADAARRAPRAFAADLAALPQWELDGASLRALEAPVALVAGSDSAPVFGEVCRGLAGRLGNAELRELPGGHFVQLEAPAELAAEIERLPAGERGGRDAQFRNA